MSAVWLAGVLSYHLDEAGNLYCAAAPARSPHCWELALCRESLTEGHEQQYRLCHGASMVVKLWTCSVSWKNCFPLITEQQPVKSLSCSTSVLKIYPGVFLPYLVLLEEVPHVSDSVRSIFRFLYEKYMRCNQISSLKDTCPSTCACKTFGTGGFFPVYLWCR